MDDNKLNIFDKSEFDNGDKLQIFTSTQRKLDDVPNQLCDYMCSANTRFTEICKLYLRGLSFDDLKYIHEQDLIQIVPDNQYNHKLLMTILVRRYLNKFMCHDVSCS